MGAPPNAAGLEELSRSMSPGLRNSSEMPFQSEFSRYRELPFSKMSLPFSDSACLDGVCSWGVEASLDRGGCGRGAFKGVKPEAGADGTAEAGVSASARAPKRLRMDS